MKLKSTLRSLVATTLLAISSQAFAQSTTTVGNTGSGADTAWTVPFPNSGTGGMANLIDANSTITTGAIPFTHNTVDYLATFEVDITTTQTYSYFAYDNTVAQTKIGVWSSDTEQTTASAPLASNKALSYFNHNTNDQMIWTLTKVTTVADTATNLLDVDGGIKLNGISGIGLNNYRNEDAVINGVTYNSTNKTPTITTKLSAPNKFQIGAGTTSSYNVDKITIEFDTYTAPAGETEVTGYDAITAPDAGFAGDANFADAAAVIAALPTTATITGTADTVPVTWADTDSYDNTTAGSYTFTATIGALPAGYVDDVDTISAIEVEVVEAALTEITGYDAVTAPAGGSLTNPVFADSAAVVVGLPATITVTGTSDTVPITWADTDTYDNTTAGSYTFTGTVGALPAGYEDEVDTISTVEVEVVVTETDFSTANATITGAEIGKDTSATWNTIFSDIPTDTTGPTSSTGKISVKLEAGTVNEAIYEITLTVTAQGEGTATNPKLRFRETSGNYFIGVSSDAHAGSEIRAVATGDPLVTQFREGLYWSVDSIKTGGSDAASTIKFGIAQFSMGSANAAEVYEFLTDVDKTTPVVVTGGTATFGATPFTENALPSKYVNHFTNPKANGSSPTYDFSSMQFKFGTDVITPALGVDVKQTGTLVEWSVEEELDVKEYQLVNVETGDVVATVIADGSNAYSVTVEEGVVVELVVVDNNGDKQSFTPADGNIVSNTYELVEGWNLIATTGDNADLSEVEAATAGTMWSWDGSQYVASDAQDAFTGVWVYATEAASVTTTAIKAGSTLTLQPGWSLAGPANNVNRSEDVTVFSWTSKYDEVLDTYDALIKGQGYWFFATEETEIDVD